MSSKSIYRFYVYAYLRSSDSTTAKAGTPYYIGKGTGRRAWSKNKKQKVKIPSDEQNIVIISNNITEIMAFALERKMIRWYGRKDLKTGILINRTDGGEGPSGVVISNSARIKISNALKGIPKSKEHIRKVSEANRKPHPSMRGRKFSEEHKRKISEARTGMIFSDDHIRNMSSVRIGVKRTPHTEETKQKISKATSKPKPEGFGEKVSSALTGRKLSQEHKESIKTSCVGKEMRTVKCLLSGKQYNIPKLDSTPIMHVESVTAYKLFVINGKFLTPSKERITEFFTNLTMNHIKTWAMGVGSQNTNLVLQNCEIIDASKLSHFELTNLVDQYEWIG